MSTNCGIAIKTEKGYRTIYCHHDGYPEYMAKMLTGHYNSEELAAKLISLGNASYIDKLLEPTSDFHRFGMPEPNVSMFYHRDRGEDWECVSPQCFNKIELLNLFWYVYIWEEGQWNTYKGRRKLY